MEPRRQRDDISELDDFLSVHPQITVSDPGITRTGLWEVRTPDGLITFSTRDLMERSLYQLFPEL